ncbi:MAG: Fic family protein [Parachlamydiales bacterium]|nr:Fic family protein [Parachlamydiales bacterium]
MAQYDTIPGSRCVDIEIRHNRNGGMVCARPEDLPDVLSLLSQTATSLTVCSNSDDCSDEYLVARIGDYPITCRYPPHRSPWSYFKASNLVRHIKNEDLLLSQLQKAHDALMHQDPPNCRRLNQAGQFRNSRTMVFQKNITNWQDVFEKLREENTLLFKQISQDPSIIMTDQTIQSQLRPYIEFTPSPEKIIPMLRKAFREAYNTTDPFKTAAQLHRAIANVHPFNDGNGRIARMVTSAFLLDRGLWPFVSTDRNGYQKAIESDTFEEFLRRSTSKPQWLEECRRNI